MNKESTSKRKDDGQYELESQFILRLPQAAARDLKQALRGENESEKGRKLNVKDRLSIELEPDMRHGNVRFDNWLFPATLVDLPCVIESHKTIDRKTFYKTADICQMLVCKEEGEDTKPEEDEAAKNQEKQDPNKVEKKYLFPHGITPPMKNCRKQRFRKTLKKKFVELPEIEKEVKRLFRVDSEAVNVRWEVITEDDDGDAKEREKLLKQGLKQQGYGDASISGIMDGSSQAAMDLGEHDIFGEALSDSDEDQTDSRMNLNYSGEDDLNGQLAAAQAAEIKTDVTSRNRADNQPTDFADLRTQLKRDELTNKLNLLRQQILDVQGKRQAHELEISTLDNQALRDRFQKIIDSSVEEELQLQLDYDDVSQELDDLE